MRYPIADSLSSNLMNSPIPRHTFRQRVRQLAAKAIRRCSAILLIAIICIPVAGADLPDLGDPTLDSFSSKQEQQLGLAFYRSLRANLKFVDDLQINDYLNNLGNKLASHSDAAGNDFHFFIIEAPTINAFAGPAGYIGIHTRLILDAKNESQLAGVLAHEVAHVSQRHLARAFDNSGNSAAITIATLLAAILVGTQDGQAGQAVLLSGIAGSQQSSINFTRSNEYEADRVGIGILTESGINPQGMVEFFEILLDESADNGIEYLRYIVEHLTGSQIDSIIEPGEFDQEQHDAVRDVFVLPSAWEQNRDQVGFILLRRFGSGAPYSVGRDGGLASRERGRCLLQGTAADTVERL